MCRFTGRVEHVSNTQIFARSITKERQALVYAMSFSALSDVAMVLAIPTPLASPDDAVEFVNLEHHADFFAVLRRAFPVPVSRGAPQSATLSRQLEVHSVGAFEASFVPRLEDFSRLDPRFRLPDSATESSRDDGFVVFKLKAGAHQQVHPMAFTFPTRHRGKLFYPTVHVHDGTQPRKAYFDHALYAQGERVPSHGLFKRRPRWETSADPVRSLLEGRRELPLVDLDRPVHRAKWQGFHANEDVLVSA